MNILFLVPKFPLPIKGGLEKQSFELAKSLTNKGCNISVISSKFSREQNEYEEYDGVKVYRPDWLEYEPTPGGKIRYKSLIKLLFNYKRYLKKFDNVDVVHIHSNSWLTGIFLKYFKSNDIPVISKMPNTGDNGIPGMKKRWFGKRRVELLKKSDAIVALNPESVYEIKSVGYPEEQILKVPNGIRNGNNPVSDKEDSSFKVIFVGRLKEQKGIYTLLNAWNNVSKINLQKNIRLLIVGNGPLYSELENKVSELGLKETVTLMGYRTDVFELLATSDIFVLPSYHEGNSNSILEAMSIGLPVITTRLSGSTIQIGKEWETFMFEPGDDARLTELIIELLSDSEKRIIFGNYLKKRSKSIFDINNVADSYLLAYRMIINNNKTAIHTINDSLFN
jgi:glycosyltransferase involved in cell wall biosynthesis